MRYVRSSHKGARYTHLYTTDHLITRYNKESWTCQVSREPRPKTACGSIIMQPIVTQQQLGTMCERCATIIDDLTSWSVKRTIQL